MSGITIGSELCVDGIHGVVKGIERRQDESVCGVVLQSHIVSTPYKMIHLRLEDITENRINTRDCGHCKKCNLSNRCNFLN